MPHPGPGGHLKDGLDQRAVVTRIVALRAQPLELDRQCCSDTMAAEKHAEIWPPEAEGEGARAEAKGP